MLIDQFVHCTHELIVSKLSTTLYLGGTIRILYKINGYMCMESHNPDSSVVIVL